MTGSTEVKRHRHSELRECFAVIDSCLGAYYAGALHMYRPLAGQLRIVLCDRPALLQRVFPTLSLEPLRPIEWLEPEHAALMDESGVRLGIDHPPHQEYRLARMPFRITKYTNDLQVADLVFAQNSDLLVLDDWLAQPLLADPNEVTLREVIRSIADKGGGAHVDDELNEALYNLRATGPAGLGLHVLFTVALGRFMQKLGIYYAQFRDQYGLDGRLEDVVYDPEHQSVTASARVPDHLLSDTRQQYDFMLVKRTK